MKRSSTLLWIVVLLVLVSSSYIVMSKNLRNNLENSKVSPDLRDTLNEVSGDTVILVWVDWNASLCSSEVWEITYKIGSLGGRARGAAFSPNREYVWYLVEIRADKVCAIADIKNVKLLSLAYEGGWKWDQPSHHYKVSPVLELQLDRMKRQYVDEKIDLEIWFKLTGDKDKSLGWIRNIVESLGGEITWVGLFDFNWGEGQVVASIPFNNVDSLRSNDSIVWVRPEGPLMPE